MILLKNTTEADATAKGLIDAYNTKQTALDAKQTVVDTKQAVVTTRDIEYTTS